MELANIEQLLYDELSDATLNSNTIMINGDWGIGKTFCINNFIDFVNSYNQYETLNASEIKEKYNIEVGKANAIEGMIAARVSLFGKKTIAELNQELILCLNIGTKLGRNLYKGLGKVLGSISYQGFSIQLPDLPFLTDNLTRGIEKRKALGSRILVFFDDLERISDDKFLIEVLGYIENLSTKNGVNILIACNEKELLYKERYVEYKEKVVDVAFSYNKPSRKSVDHFIGKYKNYYNENIIKHITNLRTLHKTILKLKPILKKAEGRKNEYKIINEIFVRLFFGLLEEEEKCFSKLSEENKKKQSKDESLFFALQNDPEKLQDTAAHECAKFELCDNDMGFGGSSTLTTLIKDYITNKDKLNELLEYVDRQIEVLPTKKVQPYYLTDQEKTEHYNKFYQRMLKADSFDLEDLCEINHFVEEYKLPIIIDKELFIQRALDEIKDKSFDEVNRLLHALNSIRIDRWSTQSKLIEQFKERIRDYALNNNLEKMVGLYKAGDYQTLSLCINAMIGEGFHRYEQFEKMLEENNMFFALKHKETMTDYQQTLLYRVFNYLCRHNRKLLTKYLQIFDEFMIDKNADNTDRIRTKHLLDSFSREVSIKDIETLKETLKEMEDKEKL